MFVVRVRQLAVVLVLVSLSIATLLLSLSPADRAAALPIGAAVNSPLIPGVDPASAPNDIDLTITITGAGFTAELSDTIVLTIPIVSLGDNVRTDVGWISSILMTATVSWNLKSGAYQMY